MYRITVSYVDGTEEELIATNWHKKDDYLWISIANADTLVLVSLLATKRVRIHTTPKSTGTNDDWNTRCDSTAYVFPGCLPYSYYY